jgi:hypothetical protein
VHSSSNLKFEVSASQRSLEPGADVVVAARLTEYGVPVEGRARVGVELTAPDGSLTTFGLPDVGPGAFEGAFTAAAEGVWTARVTAEGETFRGTPFTRDAVRTASVWRGGDEYVPEEGEEPRVQDQPVPHRTSG